MVHALLVAAWRLEGEGLITEIYFHAMLPHLRNAQHEVIVSELGDERRDYLSMSSDVQWNLNVFLDFSRFDGSSVNDF